LRRALACITDAQLYVAGKSPGEVEALTLSRDPLPLNSPRIGVVQLELGHQFRLVQDGDDWHVSTTAYRYHLLDGTGSELVGWHWHPGSGTDRPHIDVRADPIDRHVHVPAGRVSIESVLRLLVTDLQVTPRRGDFAAVLDEAEAMFMTYRRWHG
jgi:hypothetical protein